MALDKIQVQALGERLCAVKTRVAAACERAGRPLESVRLVAVSKYHSTDAIEAAYELGQREFGENYVQELVAKRAALSNFPDLRLRFIGHLQRNKAGSVVNAGCSVDTVDSLALGMALSKRAVAAGCRVEMLVQVNVGREPQKAGVVPEALPGLLTELRLLPSLEVTGLMAIPPAREIAEKSRMNFRTLADLAKREELPELSMGMSSDLEVAIEEGTTMVRVGTAIFGPRAPGSQRGA